MLLLSVDQQLSMTEMCKRTGIKSTSTVKSRLDSLQERGLLRKPRGFKRARGRTLAAEAVSVLKARGHQVNTRDTGFTTNFPG
jgi:predicted ArsR family transcriptional regulator